MTIKPVLVPDHDAAELRGLMDRFADATTGPTRHELAESRAAVAAAQENISEGAPDVMRHRGDKTIRVVKKAGKPIGEIGTDAEASPGNGPYYVKLYDGSYDAVGFDSAEEALAELKYAIKQMSEGPETGIGSNLPKSDIETFGLQKGRPYKINPPEDFKPGDRKRAVQQLIPTQDKKDHIRSRLGKHVAPALPESDVEEGRAGVDDTDTVGFSVNSEAAYNAVMQRFGDSIDHDETSGVMYTPARLWPEIEMTAFDADPDSGAVRAEDDVMEAAKPEINFTPDDIKELEGIRDLATLKTRAMQLIARPSQKPMKPEKIQWFRSRIDDLKNPMAVIKLMYDLLLSGEGNRVIGTRSSMGSNTYRQRFGEDSATESAHTEPAAELSESSDPVVCLKADIRRLLS